MGREAIRAGRVAKLTAACARLITSWPAVAPSRRTAGVVSGAQAARVTVPLLVKPLQ